MPILLHTVILGSTSDVAAFIDSISLQRSLRQGSSRLALDYTKLVHRLWSSGCLEPLVDDDDPSKSANYYSALYDIIRNVQSLGLDSHSLHLLYNGLAAHLAVEDWKCHRLVFVGLFWEWDPLASTPAGQAFSRNVTHLVAAIHDATEATDIRNRSPIPSWLKNVPFKFMSSLKHFAFPFKIHPSFPPPPMLCSRPEPKTLRSWILEENPIIHKFLKEVEIRSIMLFSYAPADWSLAFLQDKEEKIWASEDGSLVGPIFSILLYPGRALPA